MAEVTQQEVQQEVMARSRAEFLAEMGLNEKDLAPPAHLDKKEQDSIAMTDALIRSTPMYDTQLLESLKAEQCAHTQGAGKLVDGVELTGHTYLLQELDRFRQTKSEQGPGSTIDSTGLSSTGDEAPMGDVSLHPILKERPDYKKMGYDAKQGQSYKSDLLSSYRKKKETEGDGVEKTRKEAEATAAANEGGYEEPPPEEPTPPSEPAPPPGSPEAGAQETAPSPSS